MRVAVVAEWYPSPADPVLGIWAHRQAQAAQAAGAEVRVLALRRPLPPLSAARAALSLPPRLEPLGTWAGGVRSSLRPWTLDGVEIEPVAWAAPPRPLSYGVWGRWMAPPLARALDALHEHWPFDVLHAHCITPPGYAAARWLEGRRGAPGRPALVVSAHGPDMIHVWRRSRWARRDAVTALRGADLVAANSAWAANRCEQIAEGPLHARVLHLGAELPPPREAAGAARRAGAASPPSDGAAGATAGPGGAGERVPTVVTVAHLVERKRHALVLRALGRLPRELAWAYEVIGEGPCRAPLEALAAELGIADRVRFRGQLDHDDALAALRDCDLFAMPGVEEPFGVAFVEAMAAGLPAIGTAGEGGPEDIAAAGPGLELVPRDPDAAVEALARLLATLLGDRAETARRGAAARATVERCFTWERCGEATVALYAEAAARAAEAP